MREWSVNYNELFDEVLHTHSNAIVKSNILNIKNIKDKMVTSNSWKRNLSNIYNYAKNLYTWTATGR